MNKTIKTIGWICLALGVLGILAGGGVFLLRQQWIADRQTTAEEYRAALTKGELPKAGNYCLAEDEDGDGKPDGVCLQLPALREKPSQRGALRPESRLMQIPRTRLSANRFGMGGGLILLFALGPILAVVGAVILLVNYPPKQQTTLVAEEEKASKYKIKKSA